MDLEEIKKFINSEGEKIILIENGKPVLVVMKYNDYKNKFFKENNSGEIFDEQTQTEDKNDLTIEDLPF
ncbi:hypothetical protein COS93_01775 [bacterium (Candidatus Gribaldobacteria) CG07_land_8_20_14_0_80_33_18]|uniref:Prevent-host-death protein n=1 Tax=bacterium (Candidatus Gribaldobacteria) CG07_land_8_20_14_0_80_33_18 TaxID=2014272 RepID=A0A2M6Z318_9BACT|nr:MAG: hypothetical protein COU04_01145 [bacterium (Candidatus Gribaldobacteria) CG10_big_fil_rev_8_21_14_0_10_33_41]PIU46717.1 MAG: hypothetical protein COS93_01775 [bacterium (Candidatus Gribaldobacteria) CG07_land_8_20_14_0_80_33_18]PJA00548.1 MAG: hypothetical protein COX75_02130 [bacterium (Candidatus Gribaldobacteria) CG_4_10_14_0_2_um_filter_33_15]PJB08902.1 MAG: hypothetical protein CO122_00640 [bacterium (Candidatus Gribaldobacteria) CG_4_9_14_3_um_filter_33_9]